MLSFLANAAVRQLTPIGYVDRPAKKPKSVDDGDDIAPTSEDLRFCETFPGPEGDRTSLPIDSSPVADVSQILATGRTVRTATGSNFTQVIVRPTASHVPCCAAHGKSPKKGRKLAMLRRGGLWLWAEQRCELVASPFDVLTLMGGSFNFDPRVPWTALDAGYSPNKHKNHGVAASPVVEILSAWGLEHARPDEFKTRRVRYCAWRLGAADRRETRTLGWRHWAYPEEVPIRARSFG